MKNFLLPIIAFFTAIAQSGNPFYDNPRGKCNTNSGWYEQYTTHKSKVKSMKNKKRKK